MSSEQRELPKSGAIEPYSRRPALLQDTITPGGIDSLPLIDDDEDLVPLLRQASNEELAPLVEYVIKNGGATAQLQRTHKYNLHSPSGNHKAYDDDIAAEIQKFGGNTIWSHVFRKGHGKKYRKILEDVAKRCRVEATFWDETVEIEKRILVAVLSNAYEKMTEQQRHELLTSLEIRRLPGSYGLSGAAVLQTAIQSSGFAPYKLAVIVANGVATSALGHGLAFATNAGLVKGMAVFAGPFGWAVDALVGGMIVAGPAYRVTIPCVVQVACIRQSMRNKRRRRFLRMLRIVLLIALGGVLALLIGGWLRTRLF